MRLVNPRRIKINFSYLVHEIASACGVKRGTVRRWHKQGLVPIEERKPLMFLGYEVRIFLERKRRQSKHPCGPGEIYCVRCRLPKAPRSNQAVYRPWKGFIGSLIGVCPDCGCAMYRRVHLERLHVARGNLVVRMTKDGSRLDKRDDSFVNGNLNEDV